MTAAVCLNGKAIVCFLDGAQLDIFYKDFDEKLPPRRKQNRQTFNPKKLFSKDNQQLPEENIEIVPIPKSIKGDKNDEDVVENLSKSEPGVLVPLTCATLSNDARFLAVSDNKKIIYILTSTNENKWEPLNSFQVEKRGIVALKFVEGNESLIMVDKSGEVFLADLTSKMCDEKDRNRNTKKILGHCSFITDMILVGTRIITCDRDAKIRESLFPEGFVTERYFFGHQKAIVGIAQVCFDKFFLSVDADGECMLWPLQKTKIPEDDEPIVTENLINMLDLDDNLTGGTVESLRVTTFSGKTVFGVKVSFAISKFICLFELEYIHRKGFLIRLVQNWKIENESKDFVLIGDLVLEYYCEEGEKGTEVRQTKIKIINDD